MRGIQTGRDLGQISRDLQDTFGVTRRRAAFIALDQNNKATASMTRARQTELGIKKAIWLHSHGGKKPRPTHTSPTTATNMMWSRAGMIQMHTAKERAPGFSQGYSRAVAASHAQSSRAFPDRRLRLSPNRNPFKEPFQWPKKPRSPAPTIPPPMQLHRLLKLPPLRPPQLARTPPS